MSNPEVKLFEEIFPESNKIKNASLILGNGASIAFSSKFSYSSLYDYACLKKLIKQRHEEIFNALQTTDFEYVLRELQQAKSINSILNIDESKIVDDNYNNIKYALITSVKNNHAEKSDNGYFVFGENKIFDFIHLFSNVINLNYDLILYWILNSELDNLNKVKDFFCVRNQNGLLEYNYEYASKENENLTKVYYPHGNLLFTSNGATEGKIVLQNQDRLLDEISGKWAHGHVPLFVSEGQSKQKIASIRRSPYLNYVYESVLSNLGETIVIYGWAMGKSDQHIIDKIFANKKIKNVAISIYIVDKVNTIETIDYCEKKIKNINSAINIEFFDSRSSKCWNNVWGDI